MPLCCIKSFHNKHNKHNHQARPGSSDDSDDCETEAQRVEVSLRRNLPSIIITGLVTNLVSKPKPSSFYVKKLHIPIEILIMITIATSGTVVEITSGAVGICRRGSNPGPPEKSCWHTLWENPSKGCLGQNEILLPRNEA